MTLPINREFVATNQVDPGVAPEVHSSHLNDMHQSRAQEIRPAISSKPIEQALKGYIHPISQTRHYRIGIVTNQFESPYFGRMIDSAVKCLTKLGHTAIVQSNAETQKGESSDWHSLMDCKCDGLILHSDLLTETELNRLMIQCPRSVIMNRRIERVKERCIYFDNVKGGALAASHLIERGHRSLAMVTGPKHYVEVADRCKGFINEIAAYSSDVELSVEIASDFSHDGGAVAMSKLCRLDETVTAVFFHNDTMAVGALNWCRSHGIRIPEDMSVIGFDDLSICEHSTPQLNSIKQPLAQIGEASATCLVNLLNGSTSAERDTTTHCYSPQLIDRSSVTQLTTDQANNGLHLTPVSARERSCIYWAAKGKTSWEISVILDVSESTVVFHLRNAGKKLKTVNRTHTVAEAIRIGIVSL